jgi:hypothetical protein
MNKNWIAGVILDLRKCAENYNLTPLASKLAEAHTVALKVGQPHNRPCHRNMHATKPTSKGEVIDITHILEARAKDCP